MINYGERPIQPASGERIDKNEPNAKSDRERVSASESGIKG